MFQALVLREQTRDKYLKRRDPIATDRLRWRAQSFRHMVHLLPGQSILEIGCGRGLFTRQLVQITRDRNPITAVTFGSVPIPPSLGRSRWRCLQWSRSRGRWNGCRAATG
jgi:dolichol-phosphate mannosyltransferase